ncbi:hypothetical protein FPY71_16000 [Aureimonas fodinaquatilis]|uniref:Porin family protein n=1 Tax=Aureimonas fodinaquatilis TaxID=2565783 RepID=A0A5B0DU17_9HYPH|nr:hypothetical protein [Aureimonas fodinaquatilis]KAA0969050.1 hypothetical protein FPY71_16000 [Aureimonas fodinaquatilis]
MKRFGFAAILALCVSHASHAADVVTAPSEEIVPVTEAVPGWALQITPYMWAAGLKGNISPFRRAPTIGVEKPFSDVMDELNIGGFVNLWARYDRFVFSGDIMYVSTTDSRTSGPLPPLPIPVPIGTVVNGSVDSTQFTATLQGGYRIIDNTAFSLDVLVGARAWHISNDVTVSALGASRTYGESFGWVDPVVGARAFLPFTEKLSVMAQADIGGFGAGSELTWSVLGTVNYAFTDTLSVSAGYKVLDVDYRHGGHVFDVQLSGPVLGATWRF